MSAADRSLVKRAEAHPTLTRVVQLCISMPLTLLRFYMHPQRCYTDVLNVGNKWHQCEGWLPPKKGLAKHD